MQTQTNGMTYADMRRLIALARLGGEETAQRHAAMLSLLGKDERAGKPLPGYVELLERAEALEP